MYSLLGNVGDQDVKDVQVNYTACQSWAIRSVLVSAYFVSVLKKHLSYWSILSVSFLIGPNCSLVFH